jgi:PAS domain S-box-containing protein
MPQQLEEPYDMTSSGQLHFSAEPEAQWRELFEDSPVMYFMLDPAGTVLAVNAFGAAQLGYTISELVGESVLKVSFPEDKDAARKNLELCVQTVGQQNKWEIRKVRKDGTLLWVRENAKAVRRSADDLIVLIACEDISDHKRGEQRLAAQSGVSRVLAESDSLAEASPGLLRTICEAMDWDWGALWSADREAGRLRCDSIWHASTISVSEFDAASQQSACAPGEGRAGQVWKTRQSLWIADVAKDPGFRRGAAAARCGLHTGIACPILLGGEALGIVEFFSRRIREPDEQELATLSAIGSQIGQFIRRKGAEQAVQASEKRFRALIEHSYDIVLLLSAEGTILYASPSVERVLGYAPEELIGRDGYELIHPDHRQSSVARYTRSVQEPGSVITGERLLLHKDGSSRWVENVIVNLLSEPSVQAVVMRQRDVTERKQAEAALRESEERFRTLVQFSFDVYWESDAQHRFTRQEFADDLADAPVPGSDIGIGKTRWELPHLEPGEEAWRKHQETLDAHLPFRDFELARPRPNGGKRYWSVSGLPVFDETGRFVGYRGLGRHITERKRVEERLRESERRYRNIFETAGVSIWEEDFSEVKAAIEGLKTEGVRDFRQYTATHPEFVRQAVSMVKVVDVNDATVKLFGATSKEDLLGSLHAIFTPETEKAFVEELVAIAEERTSFASETSLRTLTGEKLAVVFTMTFPPQPTRLDSVLVTAMDITERKQAENLTAQFFESAPDGICIVERDYRYRRANPIYARRWGMPAERIVGMHVSELLGVDRFERTLKPNLDRCFAGEEVLFDWSSESSPRRYFAVSYSPLRSGSEDVEAALVIQRDVTDRKQAELALRESEQRFRDYAEIASDWFWESDSEHRFTTFTRSARGWGFVADFIGKRRWELAADREEEPEKWRAHIATLEAHEPFRGLQYRAAHPDGSTIYLSVSGKPVFDANGTFLGYRGVASDVSAEVRGEQAERALRQALQRSEAYLAEAQKITHTGSWAYDVAKRRMTYSSEEHHRLFGFDPAAGMPGAGDWVRRIHPDDRETVMQAMEHTIRDRRDYELEHRVVHSDGTIRFIHTVGHPVLSPSGHVVEVVGTSTDITDRKREEYLTEQVSERLPDLVSIIGRDYRYRRANPTYERVWRIPAEKVVGMQVGDIVGRETFDRVVKPNLDRCFAGQEVSFAEWFDNPGGRRFWVVTYSPLKLESERVDAALAVARDLTEQTMAAEKLRDARIQLAHVNRVVTVGQLTASIAHEVNQPIGALVTNAYAASRMLRAQPPDLDEVSDALGAIIKDGRRVSDVIQRIRALVKKAPAQVDLLDINEVIVETIALARSEILRNDVSLQTQLASDLPPVPGDRVQLQQVMMNLVMNAVEAMSSLAEGTRELQICTDKDGKDSVAITVTDSGPALKPESLNRFFEAFYSTKPTGMGIGLSICRSIIEAHEGRIWATANVPRGAALHIPLPALGKTAPL